MPEKLEILIVTQYFWPENFRINDLALGLQEKGNNVSVITGIPNYPDGHFFQGYGFLKKRKENHHGIKIYRAPLIPRGKGSGINLILNFFSFALSASLLAPFVWRKKFDIIFVYEPSPISVLLPALVIKKIKPAPVIFWIQDLWPESLSATGAVNSKLILNLVECFVRLLYKGCDLILAQSKAFFASIVKQGADASCIKYYPNSAEALYQPVEVETNAPERKLVPHGFRITFAGNIGAAQDFHTILRAADRLKEQSHIHWVILGDGRMSAWVKNQVAARSLSKTVHLLGRHSAETMPRFFSISDALLVTLKKEPIFSLTIPSKVQSYLACAKPIIAALDGEGARIVEEAGAGLTCPAEDPEALADAVLAVYRMSEGGRKAMGIRGREYFEKNFERDMLLNKLIDWMLELVKERS